jgi:hypothetical protein
MFRSRSSCCDAGDLGAFLGALKAQFALVSPLMQVREIALILRSGQRLPDAGMRSKLGSIGGRGELRIGAKKSRDLFRLHLFHVDFIGLQAGFAASNFRLDLLPCERLLRARGTRNKWTPRDATANASGKTPISLDFNCHLRFRQRVPISRDPDIQRRQKEDAQHESLPSVPPTMTMANGRCESEPMACDIAAGSSPRVATSIVIMMGRSRRTAPSIAAPSGV